MNSKIGFLVIFWRF